MGSVEACLRQLSPDDQKKVQHRIGRWRTEPGRGSRIAYNLQQERFLECDAIVPLLEIVLAHADAPASVLEAAYRDECFKHLQAGGEVKLGILPAFLGRAVDREQFIVHLVENHLDLFGSRAAVVHFVTRIVQFSWARITQTEQKALLSKFQSWVTWDPEDLESGDPFGFLVSNHPDEIRACLGLAFSRYATPRDLLLFVYPSTEVKLFRPTIADAGLYPYFRPPPLPPPHSNDCHGWTLPWPKEELEGVLPDFVPEPRPEAVHNPVSCGILEIPVRCLR